MTINRAYSLLDIKSIDEEKRIIAGVATTPTPDRLSDIVEPKGANFKLPLPFLWQHNSDAPIGHVTNAKVTKVGIDVQITLAKIDEPGTLKDRLDEAWQSIKAGLVRGLSIGFKAVEFSRLEDGGLRFIKWDWLELSAVTIPANSEATITTIRSLDSQLRAASGHSRNEVARLSAGAAAKPTKLAPKEGTMKTVQEQIKDWEASRAAKSAKMESIMEKSAETGETLDQAQSQEYDTLKSELDNIDKHLERLGDMAKVMKSKAKPVAGSDPDEASASRGTGRVEVLEPKLEKGIGFARLAQAMYLSSKTYRPIDEIAKERWPNWGALHQKNVAAGTTTGTNWALPLVNYQILANEFAEYLRPRTIVGQFGTNGIPSLRRVPFNVKIPRQTTKGAAGWVGEGLPKYLTEWQMDSITLQFFKCASIAVVTEELLRFSSPSAETLVRDELAASVVERIDLDFIDPTNAGTSAVKPAAITYQASTVVSSGDALSNIVTDILTVSAPMTQANLRSASLVWIMNENVARALSLMYTTNGVLQFPTMTPQGGTFIGNPVIVSQYVPTAVAVLVAADEILLADDGNVRLDLSREASLEMLATGSSQTAVTGTGASLVSMFQTNSVAFRAEREIAWARRRTAAVAYLTSVNWGGTVGSGDIA